MNIKSALFCHADLSTTPYSAEQLILNQGIASKELLKSSIFQDAVADLYLALILEEDAIEIGTNLDKVEDLRIQRRLLRQVVANLDNRVGQYEELERQKQEEMQFNDSKENQDEV